MGNLMLSLKVALISAAVVSAAAAIFKLFVPMVSDFIVSDIPSLYTIILSYLRPPYLYLLINGIIISIVASSKFQPRSGTNPAPVPVPAERMSVNAYNGAGQSEMSMSDVYSNVVGSGFGYGDAAAVPAKISLVEEAYNGATFSDLYSNDVGSGYGYGDATVVEDRMEETERVIVMDGGDNTVKEPERMDTVELLSLLSEVEKPPVSRRFAQRKTTKAPHHLPEGKALGVTKPKRHDTLESTWKTITEGRHMPLNRHLKKSDTWERVQKEQQHSSGSTSLLPNKMKKSETFSDGKATTSGATKNQSPVTRSSESSKLRKEPSLSQDDLNRRVEAFIKKFNEEMRLQRQESLNHYQEMIRRGAN